MNFRLLVLLVVFGLTESVPFEINPGCDLDRCKVFGDCGVFYGKKDLGNSSIHVVFSSFDELTINLIESEQGEIFNLNYEELFKRNFSGSFDPKSFHVKNIVSVVVRSLIEFNDLNDTGKLSENNQQTFSYSLSNITTNNETFPKNPTETPTFRISLENTNATLTAEIIFPGEKKRDSKFPKLQVLSKSFFLNLILETNELKFNRSRFLFELDFYSFAAEPSALKKSSAIDDQYTPGIFNVYQMKTSSQDYLWSLLWKPVAYLTDDRSIEANTLMEVYPLQNNVSRDETTDRGLFNAFYKVNHVVALNVSVGHSGDGFFTANNYSFIQFAIGLEDLPTDSTGVFVTASLIGSFALPVLVGVAALVVVVKRRLSNRSNSGYEQIAN